MRLATGNGARWEPLEVDPPENIIDGHTASKAVPRAQVSAVLARSPWQAQSLQYEVALAAIRRGRAIGIEGVAPLQRETVALDDEN